MNILIGSLEMGFVGLAMALTFRLIAVQKRIAKPL
jgi:hypothetical protein